MECLPTKTVLDTRGASRAGTTQRTISHFFALLRASSPISFFSLSGAVTVHRFYRLCLFVLMYMFVCCSAVNCGNPGIPENGARTGDSFSYTQQVSFTCRTGYRLLGSAVRFCQADGTWSGDPAACNRESFLSVHKALWQGCQKIKNKAQVWLKLVCLCFKRLGYTWKRQRDQIDQESEDFFVFT